MEVRGLEAARVSGYVFTAPAARAMERAMDRARALPEGRFAGKEVYCLCRRPHENADFYIGCDHCEEWFHGRCIGLDEDAGELVDSFCCFECTRKGLGCTRLKGTAEPVDVFAGGGTSEEEEDGSTGSDDGAATSRERTARERSGSKRSGSKRRVGSTALDRWLGRKRARRSGL
jgi:hypothetical protein